MAEINLSEFYGTLAETFRRYLFTLNFLPDSERELRSTFWDLLRADNVFCRDPLLSTIQAYKQDRPAAELFDRKDPPRLHPGLSRLPAATFDTNRSLYSHQLASLERVQNGRNLIVTTGTGSGKTECFMLPLLDDILRNPGDSVRAIIIYPMNALANDQLGRLRDLLASLPEITFGRYTGDTPQDRSRLTDAESRDIVEPNERFSREEIRSAPPHILLTNFAMLEYLLLRPKDSEIFRKQGLKYVILDEAHTYSGAQGIEVSLLMRRLQQAFSSCALQFILTSATLGDDKDGIAEFGRTITGAEFSDDDVILGEVIEPSEATRVRAPLEKYVRAVPDDESLNQWLAALDDVDALRQLLKEGGQRISDDLARETTPSRLLAKWLHGNAEISTLHRFASAHPVTMDEASQHIWETVSDDALRVTRWLVALGARAVPGPNAPPLLPARYHLFFRGLRGASVCLSPQCPEHKSHTQTFWSSLVLEDRVLCTSCEAHVFPLLTCVHCGTPVLRIYEDKAGKWQHVSPSVNPHAHLLTWSIDGLQEQEEEGEESDVADRPEADLCLSCRALALGADLPRDCCALPIHVHLRVLLSEGDGLLKRCPTCGGQRGAFQSVLREFTTGEDAAAAVLAEATIRALPKEEIAKPAHGRRLLVFSDSRQRAAHFAPYLARTTAETQYMMPLRDAIEDAIVSSGGRGVSLNHVADTFLRSAQNQSYVIIRKTDDDGEFTSHIKRPGQLYREDREILRRECLISLLQHFTSPVRARYTLPALALASVHVDWNQEQGELLPKCLPELFQNGEEMGLAVLQSLLQVIIRRKALVLPDGIMLGHLQHVGPKVVTFHHNQADALDGRQRARWNPYTAKQKRRVVLASPQAEIISRFMSKDKFEDEADISALLDKIWFSFRDLEILQQDYPNEFLLPYEHLLLNTTESWFACRRCGALTVFPVGETCTLPGCGGSMHGLTSEERATRWENHHWYHRFTETSALPLEVKEHTAQLTNEVGRDYQRKFTDGAINVLSSSTTFEMGVDVGQLKAVFLRNIPPTSANYIQRVGRAGRRREGAAYSITYARTFPHDQVHYHEPTAIVQGRVPIPRINLTNERLTQRHINSFLLGHYLKSANIPSAKEQMRVAEFFLSPSADQSPAIQFCSWVTDHSTALASPASHIIDDQCALKVTNAFQQSMTLLDRVRLALAEQLAAYQTQADELETAVKETKGKQRFAALANLESVTRLADQLKEERLIDHLASAHWLPSYAFPQDVVKLLVRDPKLTDRMRLERDAEYGIAEYAPGSEVVADGLLLTSRGLDFKHKEPEIRFYRVCSRCHRVQFASALKDIAPICQFCERPASGPRSKPRSFIVPRGFTTSIDEPAQAVRLNRLRPPPNSEVFLVAGATPNSFIPHPDLPAISLGYRPDGELFRANSGKKFQQFKVCSYCGRGFDRNAPKKHTKPWGTECSNKKLLAVDLVYTFQTDTLQIRFDGTQPAPPEVDSTDFWLSFQTAFTAAAADVLVIPHRDIDGTFRSQDDFGLRGELVVYDRVPGGAGYVGRIREELPRILEETCRRVADCKNPQCDPQGSCYACLRSYSNQFQWESLHRNLVSDWLTEVLYNTQK